MDLEEQRKMEKESEDRAINVMIVAMFEFLDQERRKLLQLSYTKSMLYISKHIENCEWDLISQKRLFRESLIALN